jgi:nitrogen fixation NifU-like protein
VSLSDELYKDIILEHSQNPSHHHPIPEANIKEQGVNRSCGDEVELELLIEQDTIKKIGIHGHGCSICTASSSLMADAVDGMKVENAQELIGKFKKMLTTEDKVDFPDELEDLEALQGVKKYPIRVKCATLSWNTLEQALKNVT